MLSNIDAIIFDMDGTLVDSMWVWANIDTEFLGARGLTLTPSLAKNMEGMSYIETAIAFKEEYNFTESVEELCAIWNKMAYDRYEHEVDFKPGAQNFLHRVKEKGLKTGIASSNCMELIQLVCNHLDITQYIDYICTSDSVKHGKPFPDVYLKAAEMLSVNPKRCLVFEDIPNGVKAGLSAGMKVCGIYDKYARTTEEEMRSLANYYIKSYDEVQ